MTLDTATALLGGLTPRQFMKRHWQRKPLLIRQAIPGFQPSLSMVDIRKLVRREEVESRLIWRDDRGWNMKSGSVSRRLPSSQKPGWTVLVAKRRPDTMTPPPNSCAASASFSDARSGRRHDQHRQRLAAASARTSTVYDVFLLQAHGRRRWRISRQKDLSLQPGLPLKILSDFQPEEEFILEPGDMLYLPPHVAHDGIAQGDCMTISIGFRAPTQAALASGMLEAANDRIMAGLGDMGGLYAEPPLPGPDLSTTYADRGVPATETPAELPRAMLDAALAAVRKIRYDEALATRFLGVWLTEPPTHAYFEPGEDHPALEQALPATGRLVLDRCTRLMYRGKQLFINGEVARTPASAPLKQLADARSLDCASPSARRLDPAARAMLEQWLEDGWLHYSET